MLLGLLSLPLSSRLAGLLHLAGSARGLTLSIGHLALPVLRQLRSELLERRRQRIGPTGQLLFARRGAIAVGRVDLVVPAALLLREVARLLGQVGEIPLERGAPEQLLGLFQRLAQLTLLLDQLFERLLGSIRVQVLEGLLELVELLSQLGRQRPLDLLADLGQLLLPGRVPQAGGLGGLLQCFQRLLQAFSLRHHTLLLGRHGFGPLSLFVG